MKKIILIGLLAIIVLIGCAKKECKKSEDCLSKECYNTECNNNNCVYTSISDCCGNDKCEQVESYETCSDDCPNCDDKNSCTIDEYDYHEQTCVNTAILDIVCCGNGVCETGEDYTSCSRDCPDCGEDNVCKTNTRYDYHKQECVTDVLIPCCGNDICDEDAETFSSCDTDCPNCDDGNQLTTDIFDFTTQECESTVTHLLFDDFEKGTGNWQFHGDSGWSTMKDGDNTVLRGLAGQRADLKNMELTNYILKLKVKVISDLIMFNVKRVGVAPQEGRYSVVLTKNVVSLERSPYMEDKPDSVQFDFGDDWHDLEVRMFDSTINILVDDEMLIKYRRSADDAFDFPVGMNGTFTMSVSDDRDDSEFLIDDFEIKVIEEGDMIYP